jgi:hypothetical protein
MVEVLDWLKLAQDIGIAGPNEHGDETWVP